MLLNKHLNRRGFMQLSAGATAALSIGATTATLTGCSSQPHQSGGYKILTAADVEFLQAIAPVILAASYPASLGDKAGERLALKVDELINTLGEHAKAQLSQLFLIMSSAPLRLVVGAPVGGWKDASAEQIESFLQSWKHSSLGIKNMGYASLCKIISMCWYSQPETFALSGYPGPPKKIPV